MQPRGREFGDFVHLYATAPAALPRHTPESYTAFAAAGKRLCGLASAHVISLHCIHHSDKMMVRSHHARHKKDAARPSSCSRKTIDRSEHDKMPEQQYAAAPDGRAVGIVASLPIHHCRHRSFSTRLSFLLPSRTLAADRVEISPSQSEVNTGKDRKQRFWSSFFRHVHS